MKSKFAAVTLSIVFFLLVPFDFSKSTIAFPSYEYYIQKNLALLAYKIEDSLFAEILFYANIVFQ